MAEKIRPHEDPENTIRMAELRVTIVAGTDSITQGQSLADELVDAWLSDDYRRGTLIRAQGEEKVIWPETGVVADG